MLGIGTFVPGYLICEDQSDTGGCAGSALGVGAVATFCGAVIGALIGGGIEKEDRSATRPDP